MKTLRRSIRKSEVGGEPLAAPFRSFHDAGMILRRAEVSIIAGTPGAGKSTVALHIAARLKQPTLYFSADTNAHTMAMRLLAMTGKMTQQKAETIMTNSPDTAEAILSENSHLFWSFEPSPTLKDIDEEVTAFETVWGRSPTLIVIDNLMDIALDGHEEFAAMRQIMKELKYLARDTNAAVLVLHHTQEGSAGYPCQPRSALQGKVAQIPAMVLTVGQQALPNGIDSYLCIAPVKNRYGRADQTGNTYITMSFDPASMYLEDVIKDYTSTTFDQEEMDL